MSDLTIMKNLFKKKYREYKEDILTIIQNISRESVKGFLKNGLRELKESVQKSLEKTSAKNWYFKADLFLTCAGFGLMKRWMLWFGRATAQFIVFPNGLNQNF